MRYFDRKRFQIKIVSHFIALVGISSISFAQTFCLLLRFLFDHKSIQERPNTFPISNSQGLVMCSLYRSKFSLMNERQIELMSILFDLLLKPFLSASLQVSLYLIIYHVILYGSHFCLILRLMTSFQSFIDISLKFA
jgi:hypothetical protein